MVNDALEIVHLRNNFYRDNYRRVVTALLVCLLVIIILIGMLFYQITHTPTPKYFATTADGQLIPLVPLDRPNQTDQAVLQWAQMASVDAYSYNFVNYREALSAARDYFTQNGWSQFIAGLEASNNLELIKDKKLVMSAVATGAPVVLQEGDLNGNYTWKVQMPMLVSLQSASEVVQQPLTITMMISRVSTLQNPRGMAIAQFVAEQRSGA